jgi:hypothetical protein
MADRKKMEEWVRKQFKKDATVLSSILVAGLKKEFKGTLDLPRIRQLRAEFGWALGPGGKAVKLNENGQNANVVVVNPNTQPTLVAESAQRLSNLIRQVKQEMAEQGITLLDIPVDGHAQASVMVKRQIHV